LQVEIEAKEKQVEDNKAEGSLEADFSNYIFVIFEKP